jgi:hypothetical protein
VDSCSLFFFFYIGACKVSFRLALTFSHHTMLQLTSLFLLPPAPSPPAHNGSHTTAFFRCSACPPPLCLGCRGTPCCGKKFST